MQYQAILFDFDGVLADTEPVHFACWQEILGGFGVHLDWQTYCDHGIGVSDRLLLARLAQYADPPLEVERLIAEYPRKKALFCERMLECQPFSSDVLQLLRELEAYKMAVVTSSGQAEIEPILERGGVRHLFGAIVYAADVKRLKPAPDPYLVAMERLGVRTGLAIEDSDAGVESAQAAGLDVLRVHSQSEMPALLRAKLAIQSELPLPHAGARDAEPR